MLVGVAFISIGQVSIYDRVNDNSKEHERLHLLIKDSVRMHDYFNNQYKGDAYIPCSVRIECKK